MEIVHSQREKSDICIMPPSELSAPIYQRISASMHMSPSTNNAGSHIKISSAMPLKKRQPPNSMNLQVFVLSE